MSPIAARAPRHHKPVADYREISCVCNLRWPRLRFRGVPSNVIAVQIHEHTRSTEVCLVSRSNPALIEGGQMNRVPRIIGTCLLFLALAIPSPTVAQNQENSPADLWSVRSDLLTNDLLADGSALSPFDRALLWARLAEMWWNLRPENAREWLKKSVESVKPPSDLAQEEETVRKRRYATIRALNGIVISLDRTLSDQLIAQLSAEKNQSSAEALVEAAKVLLDDDPKRAAELGSASLRVGRTNQLFTLLWKMRTRDPQLADKLFRETLTAAQATSDVQLFNSLAGAAFIQKEFPSATASVAPEYLQIQLLSVLSAALLRAPTSPGDEGPICQLAPIAAPLLDEFFRLLPSQAPYVRAVVVRCQPLLSNSGRREVANNINDVPLRSIDDLVKAASEAGDPKLAMLHLMRAASMASQEKDFDHAISILETISKQTLEASGNLNAWEDARWNFAASAALAHFKRHDFFMMARVIEATPSKLRPFLQVEISDKVLADGYRGNAIELLRDARVGLAKLDAADSIYAYLKLTYVYARILPTDTVDVLSEAVKAINTAERLKSINTKGKSQPAELWRPITMPDSLLDINEQSVALALSYIDPPVMRVSLRCGLLSSMLARLRATKPSPKSL